VVCSVGDVGSGQREQQASLRVVGLSRVEQPQRFVVPGGQGEVESRLADGGDIGGGRHDVGE
jgi:hypothetical protein